MINTRASWKVHTEKTSRSATNHKETEGYGTECGQIIIDLGTIKEAIKSFKRGKAAGPSGIAYDDLKALLDDNLRPIVELMQQFMDNRGLPQCINRGLPRPLPQTEGGLADLALTRPIALMEVLGGLFEKILFMRIVTVLEQENMIDGSQYGGMPYRLISSRGGGVEALMILNH